MMKKMSKKIMMYQRSCWTQWWVSGRSVIVQPDHWPHFPPTDWFQLRGRGVVHEGIRPCDAKRKKKKDAEL